MIVLIKTKMSEAPEGASRGGQRSSSWASRSVGGGETRVEVYGRSNLPQGGGFVVLAPQTGREIEAHLGFVGVKQLRLLEERSCGDKSDSRMRSRARLVSAGPLSGSS